MKPELAQFESKKMITVVEIDMDQSSSPEFLKYQKLMDSDGIPYTIVLNPKGEVVFKQVGVMRADELASVTKKLVK
jgi:hypothetical protein